MPLGLTQRKRLNCLNMNTRKQFIFLVLFFIFGLISLSYCNDSSDTLPTLCVTGIFKGGKPMAIINEAVLKEGDVISGAKIVYIGNSYVKFEYNGVTFTRELGEGVKKQKMPAQQKTTNAESESRTNWLNDYCTPYGKELYSATMKNYKKAMDEEQKIMKAKAFIHYEATLKYAQSAYPLVSSNQRNELNNLIELCQSKISLLGDEKEKMSRVIDNLDLNSPQAISQWLKNNIAYESDVSMHTEGYWQTPEETIILKTGDCEDFAFLAQALLRKINIHSTVLSIKYKKDNQKHGHAICVFTNKGYYNFFTNFDLRTSQKRSINELIDKRYPQWITIEEIDISDNSRRMFFEK